jgi:succinyl-CoA synthetase alpha subunit
MATAVALKHNQYYDSVFLMRVAQRISREPGIELAAAIMGSDKNKGLLRKAGFSGPQIDEATANDLVVGVKATNQEQADAALGQIDEWLQQKETEVSRVAFRNLEQALQSQPQSNLAVISLPGEYAAREARLALQRGLNVFLFSDNVPVEQEVQLKDLAHQRGLIVMGPDCGTAIIGGVGIGFANVVRRGTIGVIGASGTGIQEVTSLVHTAGMGVSHAIGTGSRDLLDSVGGVTTLDAIDALEADAGTAVIVCISKPPGAKTMDKVFERLDQGTKPFVVCFLAIDENSLDVRHRSVVARTLDQAAALAVRQAGGSTSAIVYENEAQVIGDLVAKESARMGRDQRYARGIFAGGTFCYQAQQVLRDAGIKAYSNAPIEPHLALEDPDHSEENTLLDLGADEFTLGRPHPMIDPTLRRERILQESDDPSVAMLLFDIILGYGASEDPAGDLAEAIAGAKSKAAKRGGYLSIVASICGTEGDPQDKERQRSVLEQAGALVFVSSAQAARFCAQLLAKKRNG